MEEKIEEKKEEMTTEIDPVTARLKEMKVEDTVIEEIKKMGAETVEDLAVYLTEAQLVGIGMLPIKAAKLIKALKASMPSAAEPAASVVTSEFAVASLLEQLPTDQALLESLRVGGVLKVEYARVVMAARTLLAQQTGMFGADKRLMEMIDRHYTDSVQEPNPPIFWELSAAQTRNRYASVFNALQMPGASAYATTAARNAFWERMNQVFIPKLQELQAQLTAWYDKWMQQATANIGLNLGSALAGVDSVVPKQRIPPITNILAAVDGMIDSINKVFAGRNEVVAIALAIDAQRLKELLKRDDMHTFTGAATREIMLRNLGVAATTDVILMESNLAIYVRNILRLKEMPTTGRTTAAFLQELQEIGAEIDWKLLSKKIETKSSSITGIGGKRRTSGEVESWLEEEDKE